AAMATFEEQTEWVVEALFSDLLSEDECDCRSLEMDSGAPGRSAGEPPDRFDPVVIASRLRRIGDQCNLDFERVSSEALAAVLRGKRVSAGDAPLQLPSRCLQMEKFGAAVESLSRSWSDQNPELLYERAFLSVSVKLLMYVVEKVPALVRPHQLAQVINGNSQVRSYIEACGGWVRTPR
ncbi:B2L15 protein, partial [Pterocles burchelli]|nr:B2L15 protein [Pterocles burchelli]